MSCSLMSKRAAPFLQKQKAQERQRYNAFLAVLFEILVIHRVTDYFYYIT